MEPQGVNLGTLKLRGCAIAKNRQALILGPSSKQILWRTLILVAQNEAMTIELSKHELFQLELDDGRAGVCQVEGFSKPNGKGMWTWRLKGITPLDLNLWA